MKALLSVIIVSLNDLALLERCLQALHAQPGYEQVEFLVVIRRSAEQVADLRGLWPGVRWCQAPDGETIPRMRSLGLQACQGEYVALLEDDCVVSDTWLQAVLDDRPTTYSGLGGAINPDSYRSGLDWGIYFCEYARFMSPFQGEVAYLPGNNVSYKKEALGSLDNQDGFYEVFLHDGWLKGGKKLYAHPGMGVNNVNHWSARFGTIIPFHYGRAFGGLRFQTKAITLRLAYAFLALLMPLVRSWRVIRVVLQRRGYLTEMIKALPWILVFNTCWSTGELVGYLSGPGNSAWR